MEVVWQAVVAAVQQTLARAAVDPAAIAAIGVTGQGDGTWLVDADRRAVRPAILWSDGRTGALVQELHASGVSAEVFRITGTALNTCNQAVQLRWLQEHEPETRRHDHRRPARQRLDLSPPHRRDQHRRDRRLPHLFRHPAAELRTRVSWNCWAWKTGSRRCRQPILRREQGGRSWPRWPRELGLPPADAGGGWAVRRGRLGRGRRRRDAGRRLHDPGHRRASISLCWISRCQSLKTWATPSAMRPPTGCCACCPP